MLAESNSTIPNCPKRILDLEIGGIPKNYVWLNNSTIVLCFYDSVETQFRCGWERELFILVCLLRYHFFRLSARLFFTLNKQTNLHYLYESQRSIYLFYFMCGHS